jgi:hypothetical protein
MRASRCDLHDILPGFVSCSPQDGLANVSFVCQMYVIVNNDNRQIDRQKEHRHAAERFEQCG